jgi:hypothetical protein
VALRPDDLITDIRFLRGDHVLVLDSAVINDQACLREFRVGAQFPPQVVAIAGREAEAFWAFEEALGADAISCRTNE